MKKFLIIIILLTFNFKFDIFGQQLKIEYKVKLAEDSFEFKGDLFLNSNKSLFVWKKSEEPIWKLEETEFSDGAMVINSQIVFSDKYGYQISKNLISNKIFCREFCKNNNPIYYLDEPSFSWNILQEKKKIGSFEAQKAETEFRGRKYTAWFTDDIPISSGPWKFSGLPGLILEVSSNDKSVFFTSEIIESFEGLIEEVSPSSGQFTTRNELVECLDREYDLEVRRSNAAMAQVRAKYKDVDFSGSGLPKYRTKTELD